MATLFTRLLPEHPHPSPLTTTISSILPVLTRQPSYGTLDTSDPSSDPPPPYSEDLPFQHVHVSVGNESDTDSEDSEDDEGDEIEQLYLMMNGPNPSNRFMGLMLRALGRTHFEYEDDEESVGRGELPGYYGGRERGMRVVGWMVGGLVVWSLVGVVGWGVWRWTV